MRKQISANESDLKTSYILMSLIPIAVGLLFLGFYFFSDLPDTSHWKSSGNFIVYFSLFFLFFGMLVLILSSCYVPYCYKVEVDDNKVFITRSEVIITTAIEDTIEIAKSQVLEVTESLLGLRINFKNYNVYYIHLKEETKFGRKIAFLGKPQSVFSFKRQNFRELRN